MPGAAEFFLSYQVQRPEDHPKGWQWYVLDSERLHQDILQMLFSESPRFTQTLLGFAGRCTRQPEKGTFDLLVRSDGVRQLYIEIKVDQNWTEAQRERQMKLLRQEPRAEGVIILLSQCGAAFPRNAVAQLTENHFRKISYGELVPPLEGIAADVSRPELAEFATAYVAALRRQETRTREILGDPNV